MTTDTDHTDADCTYAWCRAHGACTCPYAQASPHRRVNCRYTTDDRDQDHGTDAPRH